MLTLLASAIVSAQSYNEDVTPLVTPTSIPRAPVFSLSLMLFVLCNNTSFV